MQKLLKAAGVILVAAVLMSAIVPAAFAWGLPTPENSTDTGLCFSVKCNSADEVKKAAALGAAFVSLGDGVSAAEAADNCADKSYVIIDAASVEEAQKAVTDSAKLFESGSVILRINDSASKVKKFSANNPSVRFIGYYKGNIVFSALSCISKLSALPMCDTVQLQTGNPWGVQFNALVRKCFENKACRAMISTANPALSGDRPDNSQGWDDLVSRGYSVIETAHAEDFAEYLAANAAAREKLRVTFAKVSSTGLEGCSLNSKRVFETAVKNAEKLLFASVCAVKDADNARNELEAAFAGLEKAGDAAQQGELSVTPGRIAAAVFGIALVVWGQVFTYKRRKKAKA